MRTVDRGVLDRVFDVTETWNLKHNTSRAYSTYIIWVQNILSLNDPTWRWWIGMSLTGFQMSYRLKIWNIKPTGLKQLWFIWMEVMCLLDAIAKAWHFHTCINQTNNISFKNLSSTICKYSFFSNISITRTTKSNNFKFSKVQKVQIQIVG